MLSAASTVFAQLTLGSFDRLVVDFEHDPPQLQGRRPSGQVVDIEGMSEGELAASDANLLTQYQGGKVIAALQVNAKGSFRIRENSSVLKQLYRLFGSPRELRDASGDFNERFDQRVRGALDGSVATITRICIAAALHKSIHGKAK